jgi:hypothetical protein
MYFRYLFDTNYNLQLSFYYLFFTIPVFLFVGLENLLYVCTVF